MNPRLAALDSRAESRPNLGRVSNSFALESLWQSGQSSVDSDEK